MNLKSDENTMINIRNQTLFPKNNKLHQKNASSSGEWWQGMQHKEEVDSLRRRAGNETRTRDINLGKVTLYQLSYSRLHFRPQNYELSNI